jgi:peptide-methionine (S)-S-oxide reductase
MILMQAATMRSCMKATFGSGCFWCSEDVFNKVKGVRSTAVGYMGGSLENPTYEQVCTDKTGHAEVVQVEYDPSEVSYEKLLRIFWESHDPTTLNRQGPDVGRQYRSSVFAHDQEQEKAAKAVKEELQGRLGNKKIIVTEIVPASTFWKAEEYHQQYYAKCGITRMHF